MRGKRGIIVGALALAVGIVSPVQASAVPEIHFVDSVAPNDYYSYAMDNSNSAVLDGWLYTYMDSPDSGGEVWRTNGPTTKLVKDIAPGTNYSNSDDFYTWKGWVYFRASDLVHGAEIWRTNGKKTEQVCDVRAGGSSFPMGFAGLGDYVYFRADDGSAGAELWRTNGSGCNRVDDIYPGPISSNAFQLTSFKGRLYFSANDGTNGAEVWSTNGAGAEMLADINTGGNSDPRDFTVLGDWMYFAANDGTNGIELWRTDGTAGNTVMVENINPTGSSQPTSLYAFDGSIWFAADDGTTGDEPYRTDGLSSVIRFDVNESGSDPKGSNPQAFIAAGDLIFFEAYDNDGGRELWYSDGVMVDQAADINPGSSGSDPFYHPWGQVVGDYLYFLAAADGNLYQVHRINYTTLEEEEIPPPEEGLYAPGGYYCNSCPATQLVAVGGRVFFAYGDDGSVYGQEFAYLDEASGDLPNTSRDGGFSPWAFSLALLGAATGYAGLQLARSPRRRT
ncbi:MAG: hypothetical protein RIT06_801 [Chloroflexota bacterium]|jgi:ELWxxDGT repeat protein